jgi:hypothetical protein
MWPVTLSRENQLRRSPQGARMVVRLALRAEPPLGLVAVVKQHRPAARAIAVFDILEKVADEPRLLQIDLPIARGAAH